MTRRRAFRRARSGTWRSIASRSSGCTRTRKTAKVMTSFGRKPNMERKRGVTQNSSRTMSQTHRPRFADSVARLMRSSLSTSARSARRRVARLKRRPAMSADCTVTTANNPEDQPATLLPKRRQLDLKDSQRRSGITRCRGRLMASRRLHRSARSTYYKKNNTNQHCPRILGTTFAAVFSARFMHCTTVPSYKGNVSRHTPA